MRSSLALTWRFVLGFVIGVLGGMFAVESQAARYVKAEISLEGKVVLEGSTGDAGREDADEVWGYQLFDRRFIRRSDAARLKTPLRSRATAR